MTMKFFRTRFPTVGVLVAVFTFALLLSTGHRAWSETARTIKIVVPFAPGGPTDFLARLLGEQIGEAQGLTVQVENRPGAGTIIATEAVSRAVPNGNTLLLVANSFVINPNLKKLNYDPLTDFEPICYLVKSPQVIVVNSTSPYHSLIDLFDAARNKPGALTLASVGPATAQNIAIEQLKRMANINMTFVPFSGDAPAINALLGGHVTSAFLNYSTAVSQIESGKVRAIAAASKSRIEPLPDLPTVAEAGYKDFDVAVWFGLVTPAGTPTKIILQLADWFTAAMRAPEVITKLRGQGLYPVGMCGKDFAAYIRKQYENYDRAIRDANIKRE
jgi:tripartite-type tricarboxylate transporter receptor subunit TctC